jgi:hypothetical protein
MEQRPTPESRILEAKDASGHEHADDGKFGSGGGAASHADAPKPTGSRPLQLYSGQIAMAGSKHAKNLSAEMSSYAKAAERGEDVSGQVEPAALEAANGMGSTLKKAYSTFSNDLKDNFTPEELEGVSDKLDAMKNEIKSLSAAATAAGKSAADHVSDFAANSIDRKTVAKGIADSASKISAIGNDGADKFKIHQRTIIAALHQSKLKESEGDL